MSLAYFDTYKYVKLLEQADFTKKQAEALTEAQMIATQSVLSQVATQSDMRELRSDMQVEFQDVRSEMRAEFQNVRSEMKVEFQNVRSEMQAEFQNVRSEMQAEFNDVRSEMRTGLQDVRADMKQCELRMKAFTHQSTITIIVSVIAIAGVILAAIPYLT